MVQKFYLRNTTANPTPTAGEKSTALTASQADNATGAEETRSLDAAKGASQTSIAQTTDATTSARLGYHARFASLPLKAGTYGNGTWDMAMAISESAAQSNFFLAFSLYFWRPSNNTVVGFVYDVDATVGSEPPTSETGERNNITGANVTIQDGDILVLEVWRKQTQAMATAYTNALWFDGTTDPTDGTGTTDAASYISAPADIPLAPTVVSKTFTIDAILFNSRTKTFTLDAILKATTPKTFSIDTILKLSNILKAFTLDAYLLQTQSKTFTLDATLFLQPTKDFSIDAILKQTQTKSFTIDAYLKTTISKNFTLDAILKATFSKEFTIDAILQKTQSKDFFLDAILQTTQSKTHTIDAILLETSSKSFTIDAILTSPVVVQTKTFTTDAFLQSTFTKSFSLDAILQAQAQDLPIISRVRPIRLPKILTQYFSIPKPIQRSIYGYFTLEASRQISKKAKLNFKLQQEISLQRNLILSISQTKRNSHKISSLILNLESFKRSNQILAQIVAFHHQIYPIKLQVTESHSVISQLKFTVTDVS